MGKVNIFKPLSLSHLAVRDAQKSAGQFKPPLADRVKLCIDIPFSLTQGEYCHGVVCGLYGLI